MKILTNKKCPACNASLVFDAEMEGRELTCPKCKAVYNYRVYMEAQKTKTKPVSITDILKHDGVFNPRTTEGISDIMAQKKQEEIVKGNCVKCKREKLTIVARGLCWKCYDEERKGTNKRGYNRKARPTPSAENLDVKHTGIVGPDGVVIPVRLEITVSLKVETR